MALIRLWTPQAEPHNKLLHFPGIADFSAANSITTFSMRSKASRKMPREVA